MAEAILAINAGSSSLKCRLILADENRTELKELAANAWAVGDEPVDHVLEWADAQLNGATLVAAGHRIVHGGAEFCDPVEIAGDVVQRLEGLIPLAPLHQPAGLAAVGRISAARPALRQFACFDTAFHHGLQPPASRYALPRSLEADGIRRYGFHGLSYESIVAQLEMSGDAEALRADSRIIVAHLGNGASLCAMLGLKSVDTTMGFSVLDGLMMGTRPGAIDPGILLYLLGEKGWSHGKLERLLYRESGLLGVSGISADVATLLASDAPEAAEALDLFAFQIAKQAAALAASLGGVDRIIFTGGIGEHAPDVVRMIAQRLQWLGASLDDEANERSATRISAPHSSVLLERRPTQEELMIARHVLQALQRASAARLQ